MVSCLVATCVAADIRVGRENHASGPAKLVSTPEIQAARRIQSRTTPICPAVVQRDANYPFRSAAILISLKSELEIVIGFRSESVIGLVPESRSACTRIPLPRVNLSALDAQQLREKHFATPTFSLQSALGVDSAKAFSPPPFGPL